MTVDSPSFPHSRSDRVYQALLGLYPASYRREYGSLMAQLFQDLKRDAYRQDRTLGIVRLWAHVLADTGASATSEQINELRRSIMDRSACKPTAVTPGAVMAIVVAAAIMALGILVKAVLLAQGAPILLVAMSLLAATYLAGLVMEVATQGRGAIIVALTIVLAASLVPLLWVQNPAHWLQTQTNASVFIILGAYSLRGRSASALIVGAFILALVQLAIGLF